MRLLKVKRATVQSLFCLLVQTPFKVIFIREKTLTEREIKKNEYGEMETLFKLTCIAGDINACTKYSGY